ncbi:MAG: single-stranded DNA-binding protein [Lachnospiraceae bacterium]|nr:single-stranded DNA-binding protein [Lachnospiraceae bacterium]
MNKAMLTGRLTRDPNVRYSQGDNQMCIARFTLAVDRRRSRNQDGNGQTADFISCVAFGKTGEFVEKYAHKGMKFDIVGRIQTGSYQNKDGQTVYTTDVVVDEIEFGESKNAQVQGGGSNYSAPLGGGDSYSEGQASAPQPADDGFMNVPDEIDDELPFN